MKTSIRLGRLRGIPIGLHYSWFIVFVLVTASLATGHLSSRLPDAGAVLTMLLAAVTSLLFFASVLAHEMGHALVAQHDGVPVRSINLFVFGGVAQISREPDSPGSEFRIALAGPLTSVGISIVVGALSFLTRDAPIVSVPAGWLAQINLVLAVFNMLPAFPLDGGRVLRALIWRATGSMRRATRVASASGHVFAYGFMGLGFLSAIGGSFASGLWLIFIGWFLNGAASSGSGKQDLSRHLQRVPVHRLMSRSSVTVGADMPLSQLVSDRMVGKGQRCFYVANDGRVVGMLTLADVSAVPQRDWGIRTAGQAMVPRALLAPLTTQTPLAEAMQRFHDTDREYLPVVEEGLLVGTLSRNQVARYVQARSKLGA